MTLFQPDRLIHLNTEGWGQKVTEGVPNAMEALVNWAPHTVERAAQEITDVTHGTAQAVEGVLKGAARGVEWGKDVVWDDLGAGARTLASGAYDRIGKRMIGETASNLWNFEPGRAAKSFFVDGIGGAIFVDVPKALLNQAKGLGNLAVDIARLPIEGVKAVSDVSGITLTDGKLATKEWGAVPGVVSVGKGAFGVASAPVPRVEIGGNSVVAKLAANELRFDTSVKRRPKSGGGTSSADDSERAAA